MNLRPYLYRIRNALTRRYVFTPLYDRKSAIKLCATLSDRKLWAKAKQSFDFADRAKVVAPVICSEKRLVNIQYSIYQHYLKLRLNSIV